MSLSTAARAAFNTWPEWRIAQDKPPTIIRRLQGEGDSHHYLLKTNGLRVVLRINDSSHKSDDIDRHQECEILEQINGLPFSPTVFYCCPDKGVLVTAYIEGQQWQADSAADPMKIEKLLDLRAQIHAVGKVRAQYNYAAQLRSHWQKMLNSKRPFPMTAQRQYRKIQARLPNFQTNTQPLVLCHHNLTPKNIIENAEGQLIVLNWEYAGGGLPLIEAIHLRRHWPIPELDEESKGRCRGEALAHPKNDGAFELAQDIADFYQLAWSVITA